jgi:prevent-host-death family protein
MTSVPKIVPISELRQDATGIVKGVAASREPVFITQRGRAAAVLVGMQTYERTQQELEILRLLARGEKEIEAGVGYDVGSVSGEADKLLDVTKSEKK